MDVGAVGFKRDGIQCGAIGDGRDGFYTRAEQNDYVPALQRNALSQRGMSSNDVAFGLVFGVMAPRGNAAQSDSKDANAEKGHGFQRAVNQDKRDTRIL